MYVRMCACDCSVIGVTIDTLPYVWSVVSVMFHYASLNCLLYGSSSISVIVDIGSVYQIGN